MNALPMLAHVRWMLLALALVITGCGGGGDDSGAGNTRLSLATTSVAVTTAPEDSSAGTQIAFSINAMPKGGSVYVGAGFSTNALTNVSWAQTGDTTGLLLIQFTPGSALANGVYRDTIDVAVCLDEACKTHIAGSPVRVNTTLTVAATNTVAIDRAEVAVTVASNTGIAPTASAVLTMTGPEPIGLFTVLAEYANYAGVITVQPALVGPMQWRADFRFQAPNLVAAGTYTDTITLKVCYDSACKRQLAGSPFTVPVRYTVDSQVQPEPGLTPLVVASRATLAHDVVDAEYSKALNAVVMVSSSPGNALYVYDVATAVERRLPLVKPPVAVSLSPDGLTAAVGHDALVTHVDLATVGQAIPTTKLLNVSSDIFDLVLDGHGVVHVFPATDQWVSVHSIAVATNTEILSGIPRAGSHARLHPSGNNIYAANNGLSPDDIENYQLNGATVTPLGDSPYHGDYPMCGDLWFDEDGAKIYTACGRTFRASTARDQDMRYAGTMALSEGTTFGFRIVSLSAKASSKEVALIEQPWYECQSFAPTPEACVSRLSLYDSDFLGLTARFSIPPVAIGNASYAQRGLFVFHTAAGAKLLISRLVGVADPAASHLISVVP